MMEMQGGFRWGIPRRESSNQYGENFRRQIINVLVIYWPKDTAILSIISLMRLKTPRCFSSDADRTDTYPREDLCSVENISFNQVS